jgi:hypothetical protein
MRGLIAALAGSLVFAGAALAANPTYQPILPNCNGFVFGNGAAPITCPAGSAARSAMGAAASGVNTDIISLHLQSTASQISLIDNSTINVSNTTLSPAIYYSLSLTGQETNPTQLFVLGAGSDNISTPGGLIIAYFADTLTGSAVTGNRTVRSDFLNIIAPTGNPNTSAFFYTAGADSSQANVNDNGTALNSNGNLFAGYDQAVLLNGATYWNSIVGREIDIAVDAGASVLWKVGIQIVLNVADKTQGTLENVGITYGDQNGVTTTWDYGISFSTLKGIWSFGPTSTLIGTEALVYALDRPHVALNGVDFSTVLFQAGGCAFKSSGFCADPSGNLTAKSTGNTPVAIAALGTCDTTTKGTIKTVNNGIASPTYRQTVSTTGTATWPVFCTYNGTSYAWVY